MQHVFSRNIQKQWRLAGTILLMILLVFSSAFLVWATQHTVPPITVILPARWDIGASLSLPVWILFFVFLALLSSIGIQSLCKKTLHIPLFSLAITPTLSVWAYQWLSQDPQWNGLSITLFTASSWVVADIIWSVIYWVHRLKKNTISENTIRLFGFIGMLNILSYATLLRFSIETPFWTPLVLAVVGTLGIAPFFLFAESDTKQQKAAHHPSQNSKKRRAQIIQYIILGTVLFMTICIGAGIRIKSASVFSIQNDEYYHVNAAKSIIETGESELWDWTLNQSTGIPYIRTPEYTWMVKESMTFFGTSLLALRLPAVLFGIVLLPLMACATWFITRSTTAAILATFFVTFLEGFIWSSDYTRMYSMFTVYTLLLFIGYAFSVQKKALHAEPHIDRAIRRALIIGLCAFAFLSRSVHDVMLLFIPAIVVTSSVLYVQERRPSDRDTVLLFSILGACVFLLSFFERIIPFELITVRTTVESRYLAYPFENIITPLIAAIFSYGALWWHGIQKQQRHWLFLMTIPSAVFLVYFSFFADRYGAWKYAIAIYLLLYIVIVWGWQYVWQRMLPNHRIIATLITLVSGVWVFIPLSYPGITPSPLFSKGYADKTYQELGYHDYVQGYNIMRQMLRDHGEQPVYILLPRTFYLQSFEYPYIELPPEQKLTVDMLNTYRNSSSRGMIITTADKELIHLTPEVRHALNNRKVFKKQLISDTAFIMYYWGSENPLPKIYRIEK